MSSFQEINVLYSGNTPEEQVGILAISGQKVLFEYNPAWIKKGLELSPHYLPTTQSGFQFERSKLHNGLPGLFADSLPDGWGMLIMDRFFLKSGIKRSDVSPIDRLAYTTSIQTVANQQGKVKQQRGQQSACPLVFVS